MTSEVIVKSQKKVQPRTHRYVDINEVPELIARVMQNNPYINDMVSKEAKNSHQH